MKGYAAMSDFEINEAVGKFVYLPHLCVSNGVCLYAKDDMWTEFDPCNNPDDAWPIIIEYRISIIDLNDKEWGCRVESAHGVMRSINENPLRCAMIVFLMMRESKND